MLVQEVMNPRLEEVRDRRPVGRVTLVDLAAKASRKAVAPVKGRRLDFVVLEHDEDLVDAVVRAQLAATQNAQLRPAEQDAGRS
jgi:exosome complex RNA-binding protein Rrp42 (RNase PH superfamily)